MVEARLDWICILCSGPIKIFLPSIWELKYTPSSFILLSPASENTWNPPESVRIGLSHTINLWRPPSFFTTSSPGLTWRWYVLDNSTCVPISCRSVVDTAPLIAAIVPTFINTGVSMTPCTVCNLPLLARPSVFNNSYMIFPSLFLFLIMTYYRASIRNQVIKCRRFIFRHINTAMWTVT